MRAPIIHTGVPFAVLWVGAWLVSIAAAPPALSDPGTASENQFLADLLAPRVVHPPLTAGALVNMGWQACADIRKGVSPDYERDYLQMGLLNQGVAAATADVGTLVHFALRDLCPDVPNATGI